MKIKDLTIEEFMKISLLVDTYKENETKFKTEIVRHFHGTLEVDKRESDETITSVLELLTETPDFIHRFEYRGKEWGFIPNLDEITTGEFIDLDNWMREGKQLHRIAAILYRPVTKSKGRLYDIEKYEGSDKYAKELMGASFRIVIGAMVFFCDLKLSLLRALDTYTQTKMGLKPKAQL